MSWEDDAQGLEITQMETQSLSKFWWSHGKKVQKIMVPGRFYTSETMFSSAPSAEWKSSDIYADAGWEASHIDMVPLLKRSQPFTTDTDGNKTWLKPDQYQKGVTSLYTEVLCWISGHDAPVIFTCKGWTAGRITAMKRSVFSDHKSLIVDEANKTAKAPLPQYAFWIRMGGAHGKNGDPLYVEVGAGTSKTTLHDITLYRSSLPENQQRDPDSIRVPASRDELKSLYVGKEMLYSLTALREQYIAEKWDKQIRSNFRQTEEQSYDAPVSPAPHSEDDAF